MTAHCSTCGWELDPSEIDEGLCKTCSKHESERGQEEDRYERGTGWDEEPSYSITGDPIAYNDY
jgi:rubredoxin